MNLPSICWGVSFNDLLHQGRNVLPRRLDIPLLVPPHPSLSGASILRAVLPSKRADLLLLQLQKLVSLETRPEALFESSVLGVANDKEDLPLVLLLRRLVTVCASLVLIVLLRLMFLFLVAFLVLLLALVLRFGETARNAGTAREPEPVLPTDLRR